MSPSSVAIVAWVMACSSWMWAVASTGLTVTLVMTTGIGSGSRHRRPRRSRRRPPCRTSPYRRSGTCCTTRARRVALSSRTMKNCEPDRVGIVARAIATTPRPYCRRDRLVLDGVAGAAGPGLAGSGSFPSGPTRPNSPSPPWMTKPGTTRWKTTPSYQPHSARATMLPAAIGESAPSISIDDGALGRVDRHGPLLAGRQAPPAGSSGQATAAAEGAADAEAGADGCGRGAGPPSSRASETRPTGRSGQWRGRRWRRVAKRSCGSLQGSGEVDGPGEERLSEDEAGHAGIADPRDRGRVGGSTGDEDVGIVRRGRVGPADRGRDRPGRGPGRAVGHPGSTSSPDERVDGRNRRSLPRVRRQPFGPGVERRPPASRRRPRGRPVNRSGSSTTDIARTTRVAPAANASRMASAVSTPAGDLERHRDRRGDRPDGLEVPGCARPGAVEVDEVDDPRAQFDEPVGDPVGPIGRSPDAGRLRRASRRSASDRSRGRSPG